MPREVRGDRRRTPGRQGRCLRRHQHRVSARDSCPIAHLSDGAIPRCLKRRRPAWAPDRASSSAGWIRGDRPRLLKAARRRRDQAVLCGVWCFDRKPTCRQRDLLRGARSTSSSRGAPALGWTSVSADGAVAPSLRLDGSPRRSLPSVPVWPDYRVWATAAITWFDGPGLRPAVLPWRSFVQSCAGGAAARLGHRTGCVVATLRRDNGLEIPVTSAEPGSRA